MSKRREENFFSKTEAIRKEYQLDRPFKPNYDIEIKRRLERILKKFPQKDIDFVIYDINSLGDEVSFSIASVIYFYKSGLSSFLGGGLSLTSKDKLFFYFLDDSYNRLYGFWNRLGHLLNMFFQVVPSEKIYFEKVIDRLNRSPYCNNPSYKWLLNYKNNNFKSIIKYRHPIIHSEISISSCFKNYLKVWGANGVPVQKLQELEKERNHQSDFLIQKDRKSVV